MANLRRAVRARRVHLYGDEPLLLRLRNYAAALGVSQNSVAIRALRDYFDRA